MSRAWREPPPNWRKIRAEVLKRNLAMNGGRCVLCNVEPATVAGHIVARSKGGSNSIENLRAECSRCSDIGGGRIAMGSDDDPPARMNTEW